MFEKARIPDGAGGLLLKYRSGGRLELPLGWGMKVSIYENGVAFDHGPLYFSWKNKEEIESVETGRVFIWQKAEVVKFLDGEEYRLLFPTFDGDWFYRDKKGPLQKWFEGELAAK